MVECFFFFNNLIAIEISCIPALQEIAVAMQTNLVQAAWVYYRNLEQI